MVYTSGLLHGRGTAAYPSQLICNALLVAVAVHPGEHRPLLRTLCVVQDEAGCQQHVVGELIALHFETQVGQLQA